LKRLTTLTLRIIWTSSGLNKIVLFDYNANLIWTGDRSNLYLQECYQANDDMSINTKPAALIVYRT